MTKKKNTSINILINNVNILVFRKYECVDIN